MSKLKRVAILGDYHAPWNSRKARDKALNVVKELRPDLVVQVGDLYDMYAFSRYPRSQNVLTPAQELLRGRHEAEELWDRVMRFAPRAKFVQLLGNHDSRVGDRVAERMPEVESLLNTKGLFEFEGVETVHDWKEEVVLGGVCYQHGFRRHGEHARWNQMNTVVGHSHVGGLVLHRNLEGVYWELNVGWLGDEAAPVFRYLEQRLSRWTVGMGVIDERGPRFISL
jgi:DNA repair exonuclease SbcCD nuclease subunit